MCGIMGFVAKGDGRADLGRLKILASITETRGNHAWGVAWVDRRGAIHRHRQPGPISNSLEFFRECRDARMLIVHTRWATHGAAAENRNNHPHAAAQGYYVHNGVIDDYRSLARAHNLRLDTQCDSEIIGRLIDRARGTLFARCRKAVSAPARTRLAVAGLWARPEGPRMFVARRAGQPLHTGGGPGGAYLASLKIGLPGRVVPFADDHCWLFSNDKPLANGKLPGSGPLPEPFRRARVYDPAGREIGGTSTVAADDIDVRPYAMRSPDWRRGRDWHSLDNQERLDELERLVRESAWRATAAADDFDIPADDDLADVPVDE